LTLRLQAFKKYTQSIGTIAPGKGMGTTFTQQTVPVSFLALEELPVKETAPIVMFPDVAEMDAQYTMTPSMLACGLMRLNVKLLEMAVQVLLKHLPQLPKGQLTVLPTVLAVLLRLLKTHLPPQDKMIPRNHEKEVHAK
jgi:hypothetical protein